MAVFSFNYFKDIHVAKKSGRIEEVLRPKVPVIFSLNHHFTPAIWCLLDSGSDKNLLPIEIADYLGIDLKRVQEHIIGGIGDAQIKARRHKVDITFQGKKYECFADFAPKQGQPILGRSGFFRLFTSVNFKEQQKKVEIEIPVKGN